MALHFDLSTTATLAVVVSIPLLALGVGIVAAIVRRRRAAIRSGSSNGRAAS
jgi:hypothetical protein